MAQVGRLLGGTVDVLVKGEHFGAELAKDSGGYAVIDCAACGFAHLSPLPSPEALAEYYAASFYETHSPVDWADKEEAEEPYWKIEHQDRLAAFAELLGRPSGSILDIGCGGGWLLQYAAAAGWEVQGIEPSRSMWERARHRAPVILGTFPHIDLGARRFDVVNLKLVLEHVPDPARLLLEVREVLAPGGLVCIAVPNDFNRLQAAVRQRYDKTAWWISAPAHVNYFSFDSLERLLSRTGYAPVRREATYPMEWFLLQGIDYIGRDEIGRQCHTQRMTFEANLEAAGLSDLRQSFGRWLATQQIGREAIVFAKTTGAD
jgi:SAM-dependent methyltransferase